MKLSDGEKLIAIMLADIMEANRTNGEVDPAFVKEAISSGHMWALKWKYPGIFEEDDDPEVVQETADILDMCRVIEGSINQLDDAERDTIPEDDRAVFIGFDANNEDHYGVARMFLTKMDLWPEFADRPLNSHMHTLGYYHAKKARYDATPRAMGGNLTLAQITHILG